MKVPVLIVVAFSLYIYQFPTDGWRYGSSDARQGAFTAELTRVVEETMRPEAVSLWLKR